MKSPFMILMLLLGLFLLLPLQGVLVQAASSTVVNAAPSNSAPSLGETFTVNITISNVQNLFALDVEFSWNASVLQVLSTNLRLGVESHPDGVLHEDLPDYPIDVLMDVSSPETGDYHILATSVGSTDAFSGSGNVAIITFNVTSLGQAGFELESELSDKLVPGEQSANLIEHSDSVGTVNIIPEFPSIVIVGLFLAFATAVAVFSKKRLQQTVQHI